MRSNGSIGRVKVVPKHFGDASAKKGAELVEGAPAEKRMSQSKQAEDPPAEVLRLFQVGDGRTVMVGKKRKQVKRAMMIMIGATMLAKLCHHHNHLQWGEAELSRSTNCPGTDKLVVPVYKMPGSDKLVVHVYKMPG